MKGVKDIVAWERELQKIQARRLQREIDEMISKPLDEEALEAIRRNRETGK